MYDFLDSAPLWMPGLVAMGLLTLMSGFFSSSETAFFYLTRDRIRGFSTGSSRERLVASLMVDPDRLLTAILFWNLVINLAYFAVSIVIAHRLADAGRTTAAGVFGVLSVFAMILLGEVLPKSMAVVFKSGLAPLVSWPMAIAIRMLDPLLPILGRIARSLRRAFWPNLRREPFLRAEDLEQAVDTSGVNAAIVQQEREVLHNILDLSEITVEEVMRPRGMFRGLKTPCHLAHLNGEVPDGDFLLLLEPEGDGIDRAVPLASFSSVPREHLEEAAENVVRIPWCADLAYALHLMREQFCSIAEVVNEYGETIGVVSYDDILDTILLPQPSRAKRLLRREPVLEIAPGRFHVDGITTLRYLSRRLGIDYDPDTESVVTVAGLFHEHLETVPVVGDECEWRNRRLRVIDVSERGALRAMVSSEPLGANGMSNDNGSSTRVPS